MSNPKVAFALIGVLGVAIVGTLVAQNADSLATLFSSFDPAEVRKMLDRGEIKDAEVELEARLASAPDDYKAVQLLGEAWLADPRYGDRRGVEKIDELLERIPDDHPEALLARTRQAELALMELHEIVRAEELLKRALKVAPNDVRANGMMWTVYQLTQRFMHAEPFYQKVYANSAPSARMKILSDWYVSQFRPFLPNASYDQRLKFNDPPMMAELKRYALFIDNEQVQQIPRAAAARNYIQREDPAEAVRLLALDDVDRSKHEPAYLSVLIEGLVGTGELDKAKAEFANWPEGSDGYLYDSVKALIADEVDGDYPAAIELYRKCVNQWPGPVDIRLRNRYVACLKKARRTKEAEEAEKGVNEVLAIFTDERLQALMSQCVDALPNPQAVEYFASFYQRLGRDEEVQRWRATLDVIRNTQVPGMPSAPIGRQSPGGGSF